MNRLSGNPSLYLEQHANNPVHWQPWDQAALDEARSRDIPILLSIGYSACHWCHVMAHESFEDTDTAALMNDLFVNIKVDREERPDLDKVYQLSHQLFNGRGGGWPLTVVLDPQDLSPFFTGTYFPVKARQGMPAFQDVLRQLRRWFDSQRGEIKRQSTHLHMAVTSIQGVVEHTDDLTAKPLGLALQTVLQQHDRAYGGFGAAPKFPQAPLLTFISRLCSGLGSAADAAASMEEILHHTLQAMAAGGLRDHLDGGFFRYSVDGSWTIPHFEKMLYDNALLLPLYAEASLRLRSANRSDCGFADVAIGIVDWLDDQMASVEGGYCASIDADAEGVEGGFHVWTVSAIRNTLSDEQYHWFSRAYGLDQPPNFENRFWHLTRRVTTHTLAAGSPSTRVRIDELLQQSRDILHRCRSERAHPGTDPKRLTGWNALIVDGLVRAGAALDKPAWVDKAVQILELLRAQMWSDRQLYTVRAKGQSYFPAYLEDYAWLLQATLAVLRERWRDDFYLFGIELADSIMARFMDHEKGGFFFTAAGQEAPLHRIRPTQDDATPAAAGSAMSALIQLGHLSGNSDYLEAARTGLLSALTSMQQHPMAHASLLGALDEYINPPPQVIITGTEVEKTAHIHRALHLMDGVHCYALAPGSRNLPGMLGALDDHADVSAFVCRDQSCLPPVTSLDAVIKHLSC